MKKSMILTKCFALALLAGGLTACEEDRMEEEKLLPPYQKEENNLPDFVERVENPFWSWVEKFPGIVADTVPRIEQIEVEINGVYEPMHPDSRLGFTSTKPWFSTGLYAAPAEIITVIRPAGLSGKISWRIGASNCKLDPAKVKLTRYQKIFETGELNADTTKIMNYFGGNIYIIPDKPFTKPEIFIFKGAVKSPDFVFGKTDPQEWLKEIQNTGVPMAEFGGKRTIWTMPTKYLKNITDPVALAEFYDDIMEHDYNDFHGLSDNATDHLHQSPTFPQRNVPDLQVCGGAAHAGYPAMYGMIYAERGTNLAMMKNTNNAWGFYHEIGHNYQTWCWKWIDGPGSINEVSNNLDIYHSRNRITKTWPEGTDAWGDVIKLYVESTEKDKSFEAKETDVLGKVINGNNARILPFIQLAQKYGWRLYAYLGKTSRELPNKYASKLSVNSGRREFFCKRVCEYANADMRPFFDAWGIKYSVVAAADMAKMPKYTGEEFWRKWDATVIPDFEPRTPSSTKLPDDNYNVAPGELNTSDWTVSVYSNTSTDNTTPANLLDGKSTTYWASTSAIRRPLYTPQPWVIFDMKVENIVSYIKYTHRDYYNGGQGRRVNCEHFKLEIRSKETDEWTLVGEFHTLENGPTGSPAQKFELANPVQGRFIKLTFIRAFNRPGQTADNYEGGAVCMAEFAAGGKPATEDGGDGGGDPDFPDWN